VLADASERGAVGSKLAPSPRTGKVLEAGNVRGPRSTYDERGFEAVMVRTRDIVERRAV
jgi:hypothetical protein